METIHTSKHTAYSTILLLLLFDVREDLIKAENTKNQLYKH